MKKRTRTRSKTPLIEPLLATPRAVIHRLEVDTLELVQIGSVADVETTDVEGRLVKLAPTVRASEKDAFDGTGLADRLRERGALAVVLAPRTIPDTKQSREEIETADPRELVAGWFAEQLAISETVSAAAQELVLETMEAEGL